MCWKNRRARAENYEKYPLKIRVFSRRPQMQIHEKTKAKPTLLLSLKKADGSELEMEMGIGWYGYENGNGAAHIYMYIVGNPGVLEWRCQTDC